MYFGNMHVQQISSIKSLVTMFTRVYKNTRKVDIFNVFPDVAFITAHLSTEFTNMSFWPSIRVLGHVVIQLFWIRSYQIK